jgi:hypothetical protein
VCCGHTFPFLGVLVFWFEPLFLGLAEHLSGDYLLRWHRLVTAFIPVSDDDELVTA